MPSAPSPYPPGALLPGSPYCLYRTLGTGGTAVAYEAEDTSCGRPVVVKVIRPEIASRGAFSAEHLQREARTLVQLQQDTEHVVEVITAGITDDEQRLPYYVMERLKGYTLRHAFEVHRAVERTITIDEAAGYGIDLATALHHAHRHGIVHQDVKPENAFIHRKRDGSLITKLLDFGISVLVGEQTLAREGFRGTYRYAAPEQILGNPVSPATDLYALGLVLFEALTLRPAFEDPAMSIAELSHAHCEIVPRLVSELRRDVPPALDALVARCLAKEPSARPDSAHTVLNALRAVRSHFEARLAGAVAISDAAMTDVSPPPSVTRVDAPLPSTERELPGEGESEVFVGAGAPDSSQDAATEVSERRKR